MNHIEVSVDGERDEEGDAGPSVETQQEVHRLTHFFNWAASLAMAVMVSLGRKTDHQQEVREHNIEREDTFVPPELVPER